MSDVRCIICICAECAEATNGAPVESRMAGASATTLYYVQQYGLETVLASICDSDRENFERCNEKMKAHGAFS